MIVVVVPSLKHMDIKAQKEIGNTILCGVVVDDNKSSPWLKFLQFCSQDILDDKDFMLPFIEFDWTALSWCSDHLCSDLDVIRITVSKSINAYRYVKGPILEEYMRQRTVDSVLDELDNKGLFFKNVPDNLKGNSVIISAALKLGLYLGPSDFPDALKHEKDFILDLIAAHEGNLQGRVHFYQDLPSRLQMDEDVANALLKSGCPSRVAILTTVPGLLQSREAMMNAVALPEGLYGDEDHDDREEFPQLVGQCPFYIFGMMASSCSSNHVWYMTGLLSPVLVVELIIYENDIAGYIDRNVRLVMLFVLCIAWNDHAVIDKYRNRTFISGVCMLR